MALTNILTLITGLVFIALMLFAYIRSRQGDQRVINTTNLMLLPILSAIVLTLNLVFAQHQPPVCSGNLNILKYVGLIIVVLFILFGVFRYFTTLPRDRRRVMHPILFATIIVIIIFLIDFLSGCL